ncbi:MAG TPA: hypothetical protein VEI97_15555 [bacterium]|nr:hypothetical protein [bacterium]
MDPVHSFSPRALLLTVLAGLTLPMVHAGATDPPTQGPVVPLLPASDAATIAASWTEAIAYAHPADPNTTITLRLPEAPQFLPEEAPTDDQGFVWHAALPHAKGYANIQFWDYPAPLDADPLGTYRTLTAFHPEAVALANDPEVIEVESPVVMGDVVLRGLFRAWEVGGVVVEAAIALPQNTDPALRDAAWASLRMAMEPLASATMANETK